MTTPIAVDPDSVVVQANGGTSPIVLENASPHVRNQSLNPLNHLIFLFYLESLLLQGQVDEQ